MCVPMLLEQIEDLCLRDTKTRIQRVFQPSPSFRTSDVIHIESVRIVEVHLRNQQRLDCSRIKAPVRDIFENVAKMCMQNGTLFHFFVARALFAPCQQQWIQVIIQCEADHFECAFNCGQ